MKPGNLRPEWVRKVPSPASVSKDEESVRASSSDEARFLRAASEAGARARGKQKGRTDSMAKRLFTSESVTEGHGIIDEKLNTRSYFARGI